MSSLRIAAFAALAAGIACTERQSPSPQSSSADQIAGRWQWVRSIGGYSGNTLTPTLLGHEYAVEFGSDGIYREWEDGIPLTRTRYRVERGFAFNSGDDTVSIVETDDGVVFSRLGDSRAQAIGQVRGDTLVLFGIDS